MTRRCPTDYERALLMLPCRFCGVPAGVWCGVRYNPKLPARWLHRSRYDDALEIIRLTGYRDEVKALHAKLRELRSSAATPAGVT